MSLPRVREPHYAPSRRGTPCRVSLPRLRWAPGASHGGTCSTPRTRSGTLPFPEAPILLPNVSPFTECVENATTHANVTVPNPRACPPARPGAPPRTTEIAAVTATQGRSPTFSGLLRMERAGSPGPARVPAAINSPFGESATRPRRTATTSTAPPPLLVTHPVSSMSRQSTLGGVLRFGSDAGDPPLAEPRLAPLGDEGWAVPPSFEDGGGGGIVNVRGADWERRLQSREQSIAMTEAELRRAVEHADTERARREAALEQRRRRRLQKRLKRNQLLKSRPRQSREPRLRLRS